MNETFHCDDKDQLVAFLYDELDDPGRRRVGDHLRVCAACAAEVAGLGAVRRELGEWAPPEAELGFTIVPARAAEAAHAAEPPQAAAGLARPARWQSVRDLPAWAQAAAAVLVVAAGLSVANLQVRYSADGFQVTTGWMAPALPSAPAAQPLPAAGAAAGDAEWRTALTALESRLRAEMRATPRPAAAGGSGSRASGGEVTSARITELIAASERRQQQELALRLAQFGRDLEVQRRSDLVRINQGFGQFEGRAGAEIARQRQMLDYIMRVSAQPPPQ